MAPFNASSPEMAALDARFKADGLAMTQHWDSFFTNPRCASPRSNAEAFAIIDAALEVTDAVDEDGRSLPRDPGAAGPGRGVAVFLAFLALILLLWEGSKFLGGDPGGSARGSGDPRSTSGSRAT